MTAMPPVSLLRNYARETHQTQDSLTFFHGLPKNPNWSPCFVFPRASTYWSFLWDTHPPPLVVCLFYSWNDSTIEILFLDTWRSLLPLNSSLVYVYSTKYYLDQLRCFQMLMTENMLSDAHQSFLLSDLSI